MVRPERIFRSYATSDAHMLAFSRVVHSLLSDNLADFTALDSTLTAAYATEFLAAIDAAEEVPPDFQMVAEMSQKTVAVMTEMGRCRQYFQMLKYFVEAAFPNQMGIWDKFGFAVYGDVRQRQDSMIQFMESLADPLVEYSAELLAAGISQAKLDELPGLTAALQAANTAQENTKRDRVLTTEIRVGALNAAWAYVQKIRRAAQIIYFDDFAKWASFAIPWHQTEGAPVADVTVSGTVAFGATKNIAIEGLLPTTVLTISNTGNVPLRFCAGTVPGAACGGTGRVLQVAESVSVALQDLAAVGGTPTVLNVSHTIAPEPAPAGEYSVIKVA